MKYIHSKDQCKHHKWDNVPGSDLTLLEATCCGSSIVAVGAISTHKVLVYDEAI